MSLKTKAILFDLVSFSMIAVIGEYINMKAVNGFYSGFYFSITLLLSFILIYRIGISGTVSALVIAVTYVIFNSGATIKTFIIYCIGNAFIISAAIFLEKVGRNRLKENPLWGVIYVFVGYFSIIIGRAVISCFLEPDITFISHFFLITSNELLSVTIVTILFTLLVKRKSICIDVRKIDSQETTE